MGAFGFRYLAVSLLERRSDERDPPAPADVDADGLDVSPSAILAVLLLVAASDDVVRLIVGRFNLLLLEGGGGGGFPAGFASKSFFMDGC